MCSVMQMKSMKTLMIGFSRALDWYTSLSSFTELDTGLHLHVNIKR